MGCLAIVDAEAATAYSMEVVQTPVVATAGQNKEKEGLMQHYAKVITDRAADIKRYTDVIAVDGYFMKHSFISAVTAAGLTVLTRARQDANMRYLYKGTQPKGKKGRKCMTARWTGNVLTGAGGANAGKQKNRTAYEAVLYRVALKRRVKVEGKENGRYELLAGTDVEMAGETVLRYYRLRFQIEFLIRDAKGHTGLAHCQGRSEEKLYNHFNMAMMSVSVAKYQTKAKHKDSQKVPFSTGTFTG